MISAVSARLVRLVMHDDRVIGKAIAISSRHLMALLYAFPAYADKISVMKKDISDPYMLGKDEYSKCLCEITECIKEMFSL